MVHPGCVLMLAILVCVAICQPENSTAKTYEDGSLHFGSIQQYVAKRQRTISLKNSGSQRASCPQGFNYSYDGIPKCYSIVTSIVSWEAAKKNCKILHPRANLVSINSAIENQVITEILNDYKCPGKGEGYDTDSFWTSGRRRSDSCKDTFVWNRDNGKFQDISAYTNWGYQEPNCGGGSEFCLSVRNDDYAHGQWNDFKCSISLCSVCELVTLAH